MKRNILLSVIPLLLCFAFNKAAAQSDLAEAKKAIAASNNIYFQSFLKNDSSIFDQAFGAEANLVA